jgi:putative FmdB family regulatory protein
MLYEYECPCGKRKEELRAVADRNKPVKCVCGQRMKKLLGGHKVIGDMEPYYDDNLETYVRSRQHRKQVMRDKNVYEKVGKGWI